MTDQEWKDLRQLWKDKLPSKFHYMFDIGLRSNMIPYDYVVGGSRPSIWVSRQYVERMSEVAERIKEQAHQFS